MERTLLNIKESYNQGWKGGIVIYIVQLYNNVSIHVSEYIWNVNRIPEILIMCAR